ncbi:DUF3168 domain-containing protein [Qipengyuania sp.]|uniref:tail completion protein gp17 n=1 Tax=Qipengyuania sp. TaxID=2004515 RepID=UPI0035C79DBE
MQTALRSRIVAALGHERVFWGIVPQDTALPYVRLQTISDPRPDDLDGYLGARETRVQADSFAQRYADAREIAESIVTATSAPFSIDDVIFGRVSPEGPRDLGEDTTGGFVHQASLDLLVWHRHA